MNLTAIIPAASLQSANTALQAQGFGPGNFSVVVFTGAAPTHAALHAWQDAAFAAAVKALPGVAWPEYPTGEVGDPVSATQALIAAQSAAWSAHDAYRTGDKVTFGGKHYISKINANVWSPTVYPAGWELVN